MCLGWRDGKRERTIYYTRMNELCARTWYSIVHACKRKCWEIELRGPNSLENAILRDFQFKNERMDGRNIMRAETEARLL